MNKKTKEILLFIFLIILFIIVSFSLSSDKNLNYPDYTSFSAEDMGTSLLYDSLKKLDYPVKAGNTFINSRTSVEDMQIIISPDLKYINQNEFENINFWVLLGGNLIFLDNDFMSGHRYFDTIKSKSEIEYYKDFTIYKYGMGKIILGKSEYFTNSSIMENPEYGEEMLILIHNMDYKNIIFNEAYHGYSVSDRFIDKIPFNLKIIIYQVFILSILVVIYLGKRFGEIIPYYEEIEREENEYIYTLSSLYKNVNMGEVVVETYLDKFINNSRKYFGFTYEPSLEDIEKLWREYNLDNLDKLLYVKNNLKDNYNTKKRAEKREFYKIVDYLKILNNSLKEL